MAFPVTEIFSFLKEINSAIPEDTLPDTTDKVSSVSLNTLSTSSTTSSLTSSNAISQKVTNDSVQNKETSDDSDGGDISDDVHIFSGL